MPEDSNDWTTGRRLAEAARDIDWSDSSAEITLCTFKEFWTPTRILALLDAVDRQHAQLEVVVRRSAEAEAELQASKRECNHLCARLKKAEALAGWARHHPGCAVRGQQTRPTNCDCGLNAARTAWEASRPVSPADG